MYSYTTILDQSEYYRNCISDISILSDIEIDLLKKLFNNSFIGADISYDFNLGTATPPGVTPFEILPDGPKSSLVRINYYMEGCKNLCKIFTISKKVDEWFYLDYFCAYTFYGRFMLLSTPYKCDQLDGLIDCIEYLIKRDVKL